MTRSRPTIPLMAALIAAFSLPVMAQSVAVTKRGQIVVAHDGIVELFANDAKQSLWRSGDVDHPAAIIAGETTVAVVDSMANRVGIFDLANGSSRFLATGETPIAGAWIDGNLYLLERDARCIERIGADGSRATVAVGADPAFLRSRGDRLFVYSRGSGAIQEITTNPFAIARTIDAAPFASDFEIGGWIAYTVYPHDGLVRLTDLTKGLPIQAMRIGMVPTDLALVDASPLNDAMLAVADPSSKRVWMVEGHQSVIKAFARGFLRGLIGVGGVGGGKSAFNSGVDRVVVRGSARVAYDSSSGSLYAFSQKKTEVLGRGVAPAAFAVTAERIVWWSGGTLVAQKVN